MAKGSGRRSNARALVLLVLTSGLFITGLLFEYMPAIVDSQIKQTIELATNQEIRSIWSKPPIDIHSYYWLYDVLNSEQFERGEKVRVRKVGPFHVTSRPVKRIIELSQNKYRIIYNSTSHMKVNESDSIEQALLDQPLVLLNPIHASMLEATRESAKDLEPNMKVMVKSSANKLTQRFNESLFINLTARQALLGRKIELMSKARKLVETFGLDSKLPSDGLPNDTFGYVAIMNGTWRGPFEIYTGYQASVNSLGDLISYQGRRRLQEYTGRCNRLQASLGELRPMPIGEDQILELYYPDFCRILHLKPNGVRKLREGLAISYSVAPEDLASADKNPNKRCYCINGTADSYCSLNGAIELAPCNNYSPLVATVRGVEPDERILGSMADFEPDLLDSELEMVPTADNSSQMLVLKRIGIPLKADLTITMFMKIIRDPSFSSTVSVPEISYVPLVMVRVIVVIPPALAKLVINLESFLALASHLKVIMYLSTIVLLCWLTGEFYSSSVGEQSDGRGSVSRSESLQANSADSIRSEPPSRLSRGSSSFASGDSQSPQPPQNQPELGASAKGGQLQEFEDSNLASKATRSPQQTNAARHFSKVDELRQAPKRTVAGEIEVEQQLDSQARQLAPEGPNGRCGSRAKKSWIARISLGFVRILNGFKNSINDASKLDVSSTGNQDKQLELLAGKIDNWYSSRNNVSDLGDDPGLLSCDQDALRAGGANGEQDVQQAGEVEGESGDELVGSSSAAVKGELRSQMDGANSEAESDFSAANDGLKSVGSDDKLDKREELASIEEEVEASQSVGRLDSGQSNQTIINRSDTSGDELNAIGSHEDKANALAKVELVLNSAASPSAGAPVAAIERSPGEERSRRLQTSKSSSSLVASSLVVATAPVAAAGEPSEPNQSTESNKSNQFDESSTKQSDKLRPNRAVGPQQQQRTQATSESVEAESSKEKGQTGDIGKLGRKLYGANHKITLDEEAHKEEEQQQHLSSGAPKIAIEKSERQMSAKGSSLAGNEEKPISNGSKPKAYEENNGKQAEAFSPIKTSADQRPSNGLARGQLETKANNTNNNDDDHTSQLVESRQMRPIGQSSQLQAIDGLILNDSNNNSNNNNNTSHNGAQSERKLQIKGARPLAKVGPPSGRANSKLPILNGHSNGLNIGYNIPNGKVIGQQRQVGADSSDRQLLTATASQ